ncbi:chaplin [Streptomyces sp. SKN60]|uniref:chaplin n=1 Tax=Streptomyces sp. SKN60 TaxID=2855506 RepID=UPI00237CB4AF|nr:chaplin [Streptomyces sp. SKN60]MCX2183084.1 chaplin [Streptomyces sp. SKN60]
MRHIRRSGLATLLVTGGALALSAGAAHADSAAQGAAVGSPGVGSGNTVQLPVHVPVNVCGNTVNVVGLLNPAAGNSCANTSGGSRADDSGAHAGSPAHKDLPGTPRAGSSDSGTRAGGGSSHGGAQNGGGATAEGHTAGSPGVLSGNGLQLPVDLPVNVSGNSVNVVGIGNPTIGNTSVNESAPEEECDEPETPTPHPPTPVRNLPPAPSHEHGPVPQSTKVQLASTGSDSLGFAAPASAALLLGGALLYRRARRASADQA